MVTSSIILAVDPTQTIHSSGGSNSYLRRWNYFIRGVLAVHQEAERWREAHSLANLALHEFARNKHGGPADDVHVIGGEGILGRRVMAAAVSGSHPNPNNETFMASILGTGKALSELGNKEFGTVNSQYFKEGETKVQAFFDIMLAAFRLPPATNKDRLSSPKSGRALNRLISTLSAARSGSGSRATSVAVG